MSKVKFLFTLVILAFVALLVQAISGFILWLALPHGGGDGDGRGIGGGGVESTFIWDRHTWLDIHDWTAVALLVIIAIHISIHWKWLYHQTKSVFRPKGF